MLRTKCNSMHLLYIYPSIYLYAPLVYVQVYFLFIASHSSRALCIHPNILFVHHNSIYPLMYTFKYRNYTSPQHVSLSMPDYTGYILMRKMHQHAPRVYIEVCILFTS